MPKLHFQSQSTKCKAYRLMHDPTVLLSLLYLKYGDIEEDYNIFYANQIVYNESSHFNTIFKEQSYNTHEEFIKRFYIYKEIKNRMTKLNEYYKNYLKFFSKPMFINPYYNKIINNYYDNKAEIFYVNNLTTKKNSKDIKKNKIKNNIYSNSNISSIDNDTENDIIFNKRIKNIIDNNLNTNSCTLTFDINTKNDFNYMNKKNNINISKSFESLVRNIVNYENKPKKEKEKNIFINNKNKIAKIDNIDHIKQNIIKEKKNENNNINNINYNNSKYLIDSKSNEKEGNIIIPKEIINKFHFQIKNNQKMKLVINDNKIIENIQEKYNFNSTNKNSPINLNNQKNILPLNINNDKKIISNKLYYKKNLSIGLNLNIYKSPFNKIKQINFYSPQNNKEKNNIFNKVNNQINNKNKKNNINPGFISINIENSGKRFYNKKYQLLPNNLKNNIKKIKININTRKNNLNIINIKNLQLKTPQNKRNKSTQNLKDVNYLTILNLSGEKKVLNNSNFALYNTMIKKNNPFNIQNAFYKQLNPSFPKNKGKNKNNNYTYQNFKNKNNVFENNLVKNIQNNIIKYSIGDSNKIIKNNLNGKKIFYPINFKKSFNNKDIFNEKGIKFNLNNNINKIN